MPGDAGGQLCGMVPGVLIMSSDPVQYALAGHFTMDLLLGLLEFRNFYG